jgi:hypothetical protein
MDDLVKRLRINIPYEAPRCLEAADKIEALIAAGNKLAGYAEHVLDCNDNYRPRKPCDCGYTEAWKAWKKARGDDNG